MRTFNLMTALILTTWTCSAGATPKSQNTSEKPKKEEAGPVEIDFSPLSDAVNSGEYKIHLLIKAENGTEFKGPFTIDGFAATGIRDGVRDTLKSADWKVKEVGAAKLIIEGHKDSPVRTVEVKIEGLPANISLEPRRVPKDKK